MDQDSDWSILINYRMDEGKEEEKGKKEFRNKNKNQNPRLIHWMREREGGRNEAKRDNFDS